MTRPRHTYLVERGDGFTPKALALHLRQVATMLDKAPLGSAAHLELDATYARALAQFLEQAERIA